MDENVLARLRTPGDGGYGADDVGALLADYDNVTGTLDGANAKIAEMQAQLDDAVAQIAVLKAQNYDLIMAQPATETPDEDDRGDDEGDDEGGVSDLIDDNYSGGSDDDSDSKKEDKE